MDTSAWLEYPSSRAFSWRSPRIFSMMDALLPSPEDARVMLALYSSSRRLLHTHAHTPVLFTPSPWLNRFWIGVKPHHSYTLDVPQISQASQLASERGVSYTVKASTMSVKSSQHVG